MLALLTVYQVPLTCSYGIGFVGEWDLVWLLVVSVFFGVVGIGLVAESTLRSGVGFAGEFVFLFLCGAVFSASTLGAPPCLHPHRNAFVRMWIFILFGCDFSFIYFPETIWLHSRDVCWGRQCDYEWVKPWWTSWCALWITVFTLRYGFVSHCFISFFLEQILTICCKSARFHSSISLIGDACADFFKNFPITATAFGMASVVDMKGILVYCEKNLQCLLINMPLYLGCKPCMRNSHS